MTTQILINAATTTTTGNPVAPDETKRSYQATVVGEGSVSATVIFEGTNEGIGYVPLATITLSGTALASDGFVGESPWTCVRARLTAISGTNAAVTATVGA